MNAPRESADLAQVVRLVPLIFHRLRAVGDALHAEHGVTTPMRGVMQSLYDGGPQTVPQMAAARPVTRQHIQTIVDALAERGLVEAKPNQAHKRSPHIVLTKAGRKLFEQMRVKEARWLGRIVGDFAPQELAATAGFLARFAATLETLNHTLKETDHAA